MTSFSAPCSRCQDLLRQPPVQAESRADLRSKLSVAAGGVVFTTTQKFFPEELGDRHPLLSDRRNIVVIADEAHRSQYDFCQWRRDIGPLGRNKSVSPEVIGQRKCSRQLFRRRVQETGDQRQLDLPLALTIFAGSPPLTGPAVRLHQFGSWGRRRTAESRRRHDNPRPGHRRIHNRRGRSAGERHWCRIRRIHTEKNPSPGPRFRLLIAHVHHRALV